jgi:hypothetical protein
VFAKIKERVIYGEDHRKDIYQIEDPQIKKLAEATVALVLASDLTENSKGKNWIIHTENYGERRNLCTEEPFFSQPSAPYCTGFLVGANLIATAGHCIRDLDDCRDTKFVFNYKMLSEDLIDLVVPAKLVYGCKNVVKQLLSSGADYSLVETDRPVQGIEPLRIDRTDKLKVSDPVFVIGHPAGLPAKFDGGANVRSWANDKSYFVANLDTYGGNSGSPVFNANTLEVEGILVRGETDYIFDSQKNCSLSNRCLDDECSGEDVTSIAPLLSLIRSFKNN